MSPSRSHIGILTKTAANRKSARRRRGAGGPPRALLRRIPTFRGLLGLVFVQFLLNSTGVSPADGGVGQPLLENRAYGTGIIASTVKVDSR